MIKKEFQKYIALLLAITLIIMPLVGCNGATEAPPKPLSGQETAIETITQTLQSPMGLQGFALGWDADPNELIEIGVQFVTPPAVALRLMQEERGFRAFSAQSYEEQAQLGHDAFWAQIAPLTRARTAQLEIISEHNLLFNGVFLRVPVHMVERIAALPEVFAIMPNEEYEYEPVVVEEPEAIMSPFLTDSERFMRGVSELFNLDYIHNEMGITGAGVRVGFIDSGIYHDHPRFAPFLNPETGRIRGWNFSLNIDDPCGGGNTHGTVVTGPAIAIAPGIELWHFRGGHANADILALEMAHREEIDIINRSLRARELLDTATNLAILDGMIIVNSAGNDAGARPHFSVPAGVDALSIHVANGSAGSDHINAGGRDTLAPSSSQGPSRALFRIAPDITASGSTVMTTDRGGGYVLGNGTSLAAPSITGVAALLLEVFPDAPPYEIKARLMNTSRQLATQADNSVFGIGAGFVQPIAALNSTAFATVQNEIIWATQWYWEEWATSFVESITFREATLSSLSFGAVTERASKPLTVTIHNPGAGTWVPEVRYNDHLRDHSGVNLELIDSDTSGEVHTFTYRMTFADGVPSGMYEGNLVFTNAAQEGQLITMPFGADFGRESPLEITPAAGLTFDAAFIGYTEPPLARTVTVRNISGADAGSRSVVLSGPHVDSFEFSGSFNYNFLLSNSSIFLHQPGASEEIIVRPKPGLPLGTHRATITLINNTGTPHLAIPFHPMIPHSIDVSFTVLDPASARTVAFELDGADTPITVFPNHPIDWDQSPEAQEIYDAGHEFSSGTWQNPVHGRAFWGWFRADALVYDRGFSENRPALGATGEDLRTLTFTESELEDGIPMVAVWSLWGDVNDDNTVDAWDVLYLNRWGHDRLLEIFRQPIRFGTQVNLHAADVNADGVVDALDVLMMNQWLHDSGFGWPGPPRFGVVLGRPVP